MLTSKRRQYFLISLFISLLFVFLLLNELKYSIHRFLEKQYYRFHDDSLIAGPALLSSSWAPKFAQVGKENATFVVLARNREIEDVVHSIRQLEKTANHRWHYPYVFLNDVEFDEEFVRRARNIVSGEAYFGVIPTEHWKQPDWIDEERARRGREAMLSKGVMYAGSVSYHNMCRFNSGFFFDHELLQPYRYYWRVEPDVRFFCDITVDPFETMRVGNKKYGFTMTLYEFVETIPTLWNATKEFMEQYPELLHPNNALEFLTDDGGETYNLCHFWSNFEVADLELWRSPAYRKYFEFLDKKGGFYYERWGDAPVHSIAAALFSGKDQLHFYNEIGYGHGAFQHCPQGEVHSQGHCQCSKWSNFDYDGYSCMSRFDRLSTGRSSP